ncbi:MAG: NTP transferase domain-containing protein [Candidatus Margulisiibacteriota bacterium]
MSNNKQIAIVLAAGKGTRMKSDLPKVLHTINGHPLLQYVLDAISQAHGFNDIYVIVGHRAELVIKEFSSQKELTFVEQKEQLGTGHAVMQACPHLQNTSGSVVILCGDTPLLTSKTIASMIDYQKETKAAVVVLTADLNDPAHYGRIIRTHNGDVLAIREFRDCTEPEKQIKEINSGVYCFDIQKLLFALDHLTSDNDQKEFYLTDTLEILKANGNTIKAIKANTPQEISGINTLDELKEIEGIMENKKEVLS